MKVQGSKFLEGSKPLLRKLINMLQESFEYVSVLGTDVNGKSYCVSKTETSVGESMLSERGFVVRVHNGVNYSEYSFNEISEENLDYIVEDIKTKLNKIATGINVDSYKVVKEQEIKDSFFGEIKVDPEAIGAEEIIKALTEIKDEALKVSDLVVNFTNVYVSTHICKIFMSKNKELEQAYVMGEAMVYSLAHKDGNMKYYLEGFSGLKGYELLDEVREAYKNAVEMSVKLLEASTAVPGEYDVICSPTVTGLIAHEAFGHGVEMDMFVKNRAKGAEYIGKQVASELTTMHDGAAAAKHVSSYLFDDEGTIGTDTIIIDKGILKTGMSDLLSALKLGTTPTGNGKRQSYERKAYARMTNTFFEGGKDKVCDMIASIEQGYLLDGMYSGMEDPKNWGIQCIPLFGKEIKDGKFTGKLISPVIMTGFVPDLLKSISMMSEDVEFDGAGYCGKGYKEYVKTSNGGPYIKVKVRLS